MDTLPAVVRRYVDAGNAFDLAGVVDTFADDALVNDNRREFRGTAQIRTWLDRELISPKVTLDVTATRVNGAAAAVTARVDGDFDKTGLPDPLLLGFYFTVVDDRIDQLAIVTLDAGRA